QRDGVISQCTARMDQALGTQISLTLGRDGLLSLILFFPQWNFAAGRDIAAQLGVDGQKPESLAARVLERGRLRFRFDDIAAIEASLRGGRGLTVKAGATPAAFRLERIGEVFDRLRACIAVTGDALPVAVAPPEEK